MNFRELLERRRGSGQWVNQAWHPTAGLQQMDALINLLRPGRPGGVVYLTGSPGKDRVALALVTALAATKEGLTVTVASDRNDEGSLRNLVKWQSMLMKGTRPDHISFHAPGEKLAPGDFVSLLGGCDMLVGDWDMSSYPGSEEIIELFAAASRRNTEVFMAAPSRNEYVGGGDVRLFYDSDRTLSIDGADQPREVWVCRSNDQQHFPRGTSVQFRTHKDGPVVEVGA